MSDGLLKLIILAICMLRRGSGIFAPAIAAPSRDAVCLAHFLSGGMWLSDRNDAEL